MFINGVIDRLVEEFRAGFERDLWCIMCQGCPAQCAVVAWQDSGVVDAEREGVL